MYVYDSRIDETIKEMMDEKELKGTQRKVYKNQPEYESNDFA